MSEKESRYTANMDLRYVNDAHILAVGRVPAKAKVLDLGAADGSVAATLKQMGCRVWAVEQDPVAAKSAEESCEGVVVADLEELDLVEQFGRQKFDVVLMLDVLEHLVDPVRVLRMVGQVLSPGGWGVISLPNVTHISLRLELLEGRFTYRDAGLLDRTHLRFFDRAGVDALLDEAGWKIFDLTRVVRRLGTTEIAIEDPDPDVVRRIEEDDEAYTYQFVISAAPLGAKVHERPPLLPAAIAQQVALDVTLYAEHLKGLVDHLQSQVQGLNVSDLDAKLAEMRQQSISRRTQLADLLVALKEDTERLRESLSE